MLGVVEGYGLQFTAGGNKAAQRRRRFGGAFIGMFWYIPQWYGMAGPTASK